MDKKAVFPDQEKQCVEYVRFDKHYINLNAVEGNHNGVDVDLDLT
jgi:hypothetical protein